MPLPQETIARARERHVRRHLDNEWALVYNLVPRQLSARNLFVAEDRTRNFIRAHRKRFWWCVESDALTVLRQTVWPDRRAENQF